MNYVPYLPPGCESCGTRLTDVDADCDGARADGVCEMCWLESETAAERARYAEGIADFRWLSRDWLRCGGCKGSGLADGDGENGFCYCHIGRAAEAQHCAIGENYRGTYDGRAMR